MTKRAYTRYGISFAVLAVMMCCLIIWNINSGSVHLTVEEIGSLAARWSVLRRESDPGLNVTEEELENVKKNSAVTRENGCGGGC